MVILLVDEDAINSLSVAGELRIAGHKVIGPALSPEDAVGLAKAHRPDIALVEVDLQTTSDGIEAAERLKQEGVVSLFVTSYPERARDHRNKALGILAKPYHPDDIVHTLDVVEEILKGGTPPPPPLPKALELFSSQ